jgi:hypothetical protein
MVSAQNKQKVGVVEMSKKKVEVTAVEIEIVGQRYKITLVELYQSFLSMLQRTSKPDELLSKKGVVLQQVAHLIREANKNGHFDTHAVLRYVNGNLDKVIRYCRHIGSLTHDGLYEFTRFLLNFKIKLPATT